MKLSFFRPTGIAKIFSSNSLKYVWRRVHMIFSHRTIQKLASDKRKLVIVAVLAALAGCEGTCSGGGGTIIPRRVSLLEAPNVPHVLQAEPAVSFFGGEESVVWVVCHNDSTHRGDGDPNASGITCESQDQSREFSVRVPVTGQAPFATGEPIPATDPTLAKDPSDPNVVWLAAIMNWDAGLGGKRMSIGVAKLVRDPATGAVTVNEPNPGIFGDTHRMVAITGGNVEGPKDSESGPIPDRPFFAIDPTSENGNHAQYIAYYQNDNSFRDQNQQPQRRGRIMVIRRNSERDLFWSPPVVVRANGIETDGEGWAFDNESYQFQAPQLAIRPGTHEVGIAFIRFQFRGDSNAFVTLHNDGFAGNSIFYFFGVSGDRARSGWQANSVTSTAKAGRTSTAPLSAVVPTSTTPTPTLLPISETFTAVPYPVLAFDEAFRRWVILFTTSGTPQTPASTGKWELHSTFSIDDGATWSPPIQVNNSPPFSENESRNVVFPALGFDSFSRRLTAGYLESNDREDRSWRPVINFSSNGGDSWSRPHDIISPSGPRGSRMLEYGWGGHWAGITRAGFFGDYTGLANFRGTVFFAWTESRDSTREAAVMDVWGAEVRFADE